MTQKAPEPRGLLKAMLLCLAISPALCAQSVTPATPAAAGEDDTITLNPFEVSSSKDVGYLATNTLAGSRLNTELKDTAAAISVMTPEFLKDIGAKNMKDVILFSNNAVPDYGDSATNFNGNPMIGNPEWALRVRGLPASYARNYFNFAAPADFYNIDRLDQARGPNSILFGFGQAGGIVNSSTKQAQLGKDSTELELTTGSWNRIRGTVDSNQVIRQGSLAVRFNAVTEDANGWRQFEYYRQQRAHLAAKLRINNHSSLRVEAEVANVRDNWARPWLMIDQTATWRAAGSKIYNGAQWDWPISNQVTQTWSPHLVYTDNTGKLADWQSMPYSYSSNNGWSHLAMTPSNLAIIPGDSNPGGVDADRHTRFSTYSAFYENQLTRNLSLEVAFNHQQFNFTGFDPNAGTLSRYGYLGDATSLYADASYYAPTWVANPNAGKFYIENNWTLRQSHNQDDQLRATLAYVLKTEKFGEHRIAAMAERDWKKYDRTEYAEVLAGRPIDPGANAAFDSNRLFRRHYITPGDVSSIHAASWKDPVVDMTDPVSGKKLTSAWAPNQQINNAHQVQDTVLVGLQSYFFSRKLVTTAGLRFDSLNHGVSPTITNSQGIYQLDTATRNYDRLNATTFTTGLVWHVTDRISLFGNHSNNRDLPNLNQRLIGMSLPPLPEGEGNDVGVKINLIGGKLYATASYYTTDATKTTEWGNIESSVTTLNNKVLAGLKNAGLITAADVTARSINANGYLQDRKADGWEYSLIANPTDSWRISANFSITNVIKSNIMSEVVAWMDSNSAWWLSKAPANFNLGGGDWDTLSANIGWTRDYLNQETAFNGKPARGERKYGANLYTNYRFNRGLLKGLSVGGGGRYQSENIITMNGNSPVMGREIFLIDASMGYDFERPIFGRKTKFDVQLNVNNVFDSSRYQIYDMAWWDKSYVTPARIGLQEPRKVTLTARLSF